MNVLGTTLLYAGLLGATVALVCLIRPLRMLGRPPRRRAAGGLALSLAVAFLGIVLPAPLQHASGQTVLDEVMPLYQFGEVHEISVQAPPERVFAAIRAVSAREIRGYALLTWLRSPRLGGEARESLLNAPADKPLLAVARASGFLTIADEPNREIALGSVAPVWQPDRSAFSGVTRESAERALAADPMTFARFSPAGCAKVAFDFTVTPEGPSGSRLSTRTRVFGTSPGARRAFGVYWRAIYPGSAFIRRMWLEAIRRRAERTS